MFYYLLITNFRNGVIFNDKIMFFGTRAYEKDMALRWGKKNNIDVTTSTELLSVDTVDQLKDYDGVTTMQFGKLEPEVYVGERKIISITTSTELLSRYCRSIKRL